MSIACLYRDLGCVPLELCGKAVAGAGWNISGIGGREELVGTGAAPREPRIMGTTLGSNDDVFEAAKRGAVLPLWAMPAAPLLHHPAPCCVLQAFVGIMKSPMAAFVVVLSEKFTRAFPFGACQWGVSYLCSSS